MVRGDGADAAWEMGGVLWSFTTQEEDDVVTHGPMMIRRIQWWLSERLLAPAIFGKIKSFFIQ
jgi:hypothetical protein